MKGGKGCLVVLMFVLAFFGRSAFADDTRFTDVNSWSTSLHKSDNPANSVVSPFITAPDSKRYGAANGVFKETIQCNIAARPLSTIHDYWFAYTELCWTNPGGSSLADFKTSCQIKYKYKVKVSGGTISGPYMRLTPSWSSGWVDSPFQAWIADGDWHEMVQPLQPVDKTDWLP